MEEWCDMCQRKTCSFCGNCDCDGYPCIHQAPKEKKMNKTLEKFGANTMNRFYIGADHIASAIAKGRNYSYTQISMDTAIEAARTVLAKNTSKEAVIIVEIVAVVYRDQPPVKVDYLK